MCVFLLLRTLQSLLAQVAASVRSTTHHGACVYVVHVTGNDPRLTWQWSGSGEFESTLSMVVTAGPAAGAPKLLQRDFSLRRNLTNHALTLTSRFTLFVRDGAGDKNCSFEQALPTSQSCLFFHPNVFVDAVYACVGLQVGRVTKKIGDFFKSPAKARFVLFVVVVVVRLTLQ